jgi:hypothetical protein
MAKPSLAGLHSIIEVRFPTACLPRTATMVDSVTPTNEPSDGRQWLLPGHAAKRYAAGLLALS